MDTKDELLDRAAREFRALHDTLRGLNESDTTRVWLGAWSVRDIVAHISGWHREMTPALERLARGERPFPEGVSYDDVDAWNATFAAARRGASVADALLELDRSHEDCLRAAAAGLAGRAGALRACAPTRVGAARGQWAVARGCRSRRTSSYSALLPPR